MSDGNSISPERESIIAEWLKNDAFRYWLQQSGIEPHVLTGEWGLTLYLTDAYGRANSQRERERAALHDRRAQEAHDKAEGKRRAMAEGQKREAAKAANAEREQLAQAEQAKRERAIRDLLANDVQRRGEDAVSVRAVAAWWMVNRPTVTLTINEPATRDVLLAAYQGLQDEVTANQVAIRAALAQNKEERVLRERRGEPAVAIPPEVNVAAYIGAGNVARWLVAHRGQYELTVGRWETKWDYDEDGDRIKDSDRAELTEPPKSWTAIRARVVRWELYDRYKTVDPTLAFDILANKHDGAAVRVELTECEARWDAAVRPRRYADQDEAAEVVPQRAIKRVQDVTIEQAAITVYKQFRQKNTKPTKTAILGAMRRIAKGQTNVLLKAYRAVEGEPDLADG